MTTYAYLRVSTDRQDVAKRQAEGKTLGRPRGAKSARLKLDTHADEIRLYISPRA